MRSETFKILQSIHALSYQTIALMVMIPMIMGTFLFPEHHVFAADPADFLQVVLENLVNPESKSKNAGQDIKPLALKKSDQVMILESAVVPHGNQESSKVAYTLTSVATAYSSTPDQTDSTPFITANGMYVYDGLIAANFLALGTKVKIPEHFGDKIFTVNDRMNARYGHGRIDIWMKSREEAKVWGVKRVKLEIIK